jgi:Ca2+-binding RTX toxin-like protein
MATVSYAWSEAVPSFFMNAELTAGNQGTPVIASLIGGGYLGAWDQGIGTAVVGRIIENDGAPRTSESVVNSTTLGPQFDQSAAGLADGGVVVTFTDTSSGALTVRARLFDENGVARGPDFVVATNGTEGLLDSDVTALGDGFAVSFTSTVTADDDVCVQLFDENGNAVGGLIQVDDHLGLDANRSAISSYEIGFVVAYSREGSDGDDIYYRLYNSDGTPISSPLLLDDIGTINTDVQITELANGGFVVVYTDDGWSEDHTTDITAQIFSASGQPQGDSFRVNAGSVFLGDQDKPSVTALPNGYFVVSWVDEASQRLYEQAFDAAGNAIGDDFVVSGQIIDGEIATLADGRVANVRSSTLEDFGGDNSIRSSVTELTRTTTGSNSSETLTGDALRDLIYGNGGNDTLNGGAGADTLQGGAGNDTYVVDNAGDKAIEADGNGSDLVQSSVSFSIAGQFVENLTLTGSANVNATGNSLNNALAGNAGNNTLDGGSQGNDSLNGGAGADHMEGGNGSDTYVVDNAGDTVVEANISGSDLVRSSVSFSLAGQFVERLTLTGSGNVNATGNSLDNVIAGNAGNNTMTGAQGADTFVFNTALNAATNLDHITDFASVDTIELENAVFTSLTTTGTLSANAFFSAAGATSAHDADDRIVYNTTTGALFYDADGVGGTAAVQFAVLDNHAALTNADFVVV